MRALKKVLKITGLSVIVFAIILFAASILLHEKIAGFIIKSLNNNIATRFETGSSRLSFLSRFPKATFELKNVLVHSSENFNYEVFAGMGADTLLSANSVSVEFSLLDILRRHYKIDKINIKSGVIYLLSDKDGNVNYDVKKEGSNAAGSNFEIDLEGITLTDIKAVYNNRSAGLLLKTFIDKGSLKSNIFDKKINFSAHSLMHVNLFELNKTRITRSLEAEIDVDLYSNGDTTLFRKGVLKVNGLAFGIKGIASPGSMLDLDLTGQNIDIEKVLKFLPDSINIKLKDYNPAGALRVHAGIKGPVSRNLNPHIEITALLEKGRIRHRRSEISIDNLSFSGFYTNGSRNRPETSALSLDNIIMKLGSSWLNGSFDLVGHNDPVASIVLKGEVKPREIKDFLNLDQVNLADGSVDLGLMMKGKIRRGIKYSFSDLLSSVTDADLNFSNFSLAIKDSDFNVHSVNGNIGIRETVTAKDLSVNYKDHSLKITGDFRNLPGWLSKKGSLPLSGSADVSFERLDPVKFFGMYEKDPAKDGKASAGMPTDIDMIFNFDLDTFVYKTFTGQNVRGVLDYNKNELDFRQLRMNSLEGSISGKGSFYQNTDLSAVVKGTFMLDGINIKKTFIVFNNFGQDFIKSENLAGNLSGTITLLLPLNSTLDPEIKFLTAEGKYTITDGSLNNFEPVKKLSSYIRLSELENITFDKLENDFYIRNNFFYLPQMDINSSAVMLSVNGRHSFSNDYTYHVKMLLSEVLSRKFNRNKPSGSEFGPVEDDGLGRTSLLLKVEGQGDIVKTGYDVKAAGEQIKKSVKAEKSSLKTILKEEYGWYKKDSSLNVKEEVKTEKKPRFRVTWDEAGDTDSKMP